MEQAQEHTRGAAVAAFFDVDRTLLRVNSGSQWMWHMWRRRELGAAALARALRWTLQYKLAGDRFDFEYVVGRAARLYAGRSVAALQVEVAAWFDAELVASISALGRARVREHAARGHVVVLLTSGTRFLAVPVAAHLGVEHVLCTELAAAGGRLTGRHVPPACGGAGKVVYAERFARARGISLARSFFYTDSYSDMPMLERVGRPRVVNPDPRLRARARARGWGYEQWTI